jgi:hypothetical protein
MQVRVAWLFRDLSMLGFGVLWWVVFAAGFTQFWDGLDL